MAKWSGIWHTLDLSYLARMGFASFSANNSDYIPKTVDWVVQTVMWVLEHEPDRMFIALDSGDSERRKIYPLYKIGRPSPPPEYFGCYEAILNDLIVNFGDQVEIVSSPGWESDDVMATIAKSAVDLGVKAVIMSNDKDMRQCLRHGHVTIQLRKRCADGMGAEWRFLTAKDAEIDWQCFQHQFMDFQVLVGDDQVDRIKGAPGVGPKTASELLIEYTSVENMKKQEIPGSLGKKLKEFWKEEPTTRSLVTLRDNLDLLDVVTRKTVDLKLKRKQKD